MTKYKVTMDNGEPMTRDGTTDPDDARSAHNDAYESQWPNYCRHCGGWGRPTFEQGHPYGATTADETLCKFCAEDCVCARCGELGLGEDADGPCKFCGWNYDDAGIIPPGEVTMTDKITMDRKYTTEDGATVELITVRGRAPYPVVGYRGDSPVPRSWTATGSYSQGKESSLDLIPVPPGDTP